MGVEVPVVQPLWRWLQRNANFFIVEVTWVSSLEATITRREVKMIELLWNKSTHTHTHTRRYVYMSWASLLL